MLGSDPDDMSEVDLNKIPIVEVDNDGEIITGFMVADNYFEHHQVDTVNPVEGIRRARHPISRIAHADRARARTRAPRFKR
jgi:hypothetical protein